MYSWKGDFVLVDGKQRLSAVLGFLRSEIPVFGILRKDYKDKLINVSCFSFNIGCLKTRKEVLQWYLDFNIGGTYHTKEEIDKVKLLIKREQNE